MCALFYSISSPNDNNKTLSAIKPLLSRSVSASPSITSYIVGPKEAFHRYFLGVHAKTKRSLAEEAESGDDKSVNSWIRDGADPNEADMYGYTPLISASTLGRLNTVKNLVQNGADVNKLGPFGFSPLHAAAQNGHCDVVTYLLRNGADVNAQNQDNDTPMHLALNAQHTEVVYQLLRSGGNSRIEGFNKKNCIDYAINAGLVDLVKVLTNYSAFNENHQLTPSFNHSISVL